MNILVHVRNVRQAVKDLQAVGAAANGVGTLSARGSVGTASFGKSVDALGKKMMGVGNQIQWTGRQLEYNWTLPLAAAGVATMKWALDSERAMTRVNKVYGDYAMAREDARLSAEGKPMISTQELASLEKFFTAASNKFGVLREEVIRIGADWAAAGKSGLALAKATDLTLRTMILGEMEAKDATDTLISIQAQYRQSTDELTRTIAQLNAVENQTGSSMKELVIGFSKTGSQAQAAGVSTGELAAMLASLIKITGSAESSGNGLKTMMSRLLQPTTDMYTVLDKLGISAGSVAWQSATVTQRLKMVATAFQTASSGTQNFAASVLGSRWQVNKFIELMSAINDENSFYAKAMAAVKDETAMYALAQSELNAVLASSPQRLKQIWTILQNLGADIIQPLIPVLLMLGGAVVKVTTAFSNMPPETMKLVAAFLLFVALLGPVIRYMGSLQTFVGGAVMVFARFGTALIFPLAMLAKLVAFPFGLFAVRSTAASDLATGALIKFSAVASAATTKAAAATITGSGVMLKAWQRFFPLLQAYSAAGYGRVATIQRATLAFMASSQNAHVTKAFLLWSAFHKALVINTAGTGPKLIGVWRTIYAALSATMIGAWGAILAAMLASQSPFIVAMGKSFIILGRVASAAWALIAARAIATGKTLSFLFGPTIASAIFATKSLLGTWGKYFVAHQALVAAGYGKIAAIRSIAYALMLNSSNGFINRIASTWFIFNVEYIRVAAMTRMKVVSVWIAMLNTMLLSQNTYLIKMAKGLKAATLGMAAIFTASGRSMIFQQIMLAATLGQGKWWGPMVRAFASALIIMKGFSTAAGRAVILDWIKTRTVLAAQALWAPVAAGFAFAMNAMRVMSSITAMQIVAQHVKAKIVLAAVGFWNAIPMAYAKAMFAMRVVTSATAWSIFGTWIAAKVKMAAATVVHVGAMVLATIAGTLKIVAAWTWAAVKSTAVWVAGMATKVATTVGHLTYIVGATVASGAKIVAVWAATAIKSAAIWAAGMVAMVAKTIWANRMMILAFLGKGLVAAVSLNIKGILALLARLAPAIISFLFGPWGIAIAAITGLLVMFKDQVATLFGRIKEMFLGVWSGLGGEVTGVASLFGKFIAFVKKAFWGLPVEIQNAMLAVVRVVKNAAMQVYKMFQYLNPFARHSPSLVENVTNGMAVINSEFNSLKGIGSPIGAAYQQIEILKNATLGLAEASFAAKYADDLAMIAEHASSAVGPFQQLVGMLPGMTRELNSLEKAVKAQEKVVKQWQAELDAATAAVQRQEDAIKLLKEEADSYAQAITAANDKISSLSSTPLVGMREMEDQIHANTMAQNQLKLEMLKIKQAGGAYEDIANKISSINGELESANAARTNLQMGGAGSEILQFYDDQIASLEAQKKATQKSTEPLDDMQRALDELQGKAELLDLEKAVNFDGLTYEIQKLADTQKELTFGEITSGIQAAQAEVAKYQPMLDGVNQKIAEQEGVLKGLQNQKDAVQAQYDAEDAKLQQVKASYDELSTAIQDVESSLSSMGQAAGNVAKLAEAGVSGALDVASAKKIKAAGAGADSAGGAMGEMSPTERGLAYAELGDFETAAGSGGLGREGDLTSQAGDIDRLTKEMADETAKMLGDFDMFGGIKKKFDEFKRWLQEHIQPAFGPIAAGAKTLFDGIDWGAPFKEGAMLGDFFAKIPEWSKIAWNGIKWFGDQLAKLFGDDVKKLGGEAWKGLQEFWTNLKPVFENLGKMMPGLGAVIGIVVGAILLVLKVVINIVANTIRPILAFLGDLISNIVQLVSGVFVILEGIFTGNFSKIGEGIKMILGAIIGTIGSLFTNLVAVLWGIVSGLVQGIVGFFVWLWDVLVGHSIIPDLVNGIVDWFKQLPGRIWDGIVGLFNIVVDFFVQIGTTFWNGVLALGTMWSDFWTGVWQWVLDTTANIIISIILWVANFIQNWNEFCDNAKTVWNNFWTAVWDWLKQTTQNIITSIIAWVGSFIQTWNQFCETVKTAWNNFWTTIWQWVLNFTAQIITAIIAWIGNVVNNWNNFMATIRGAWDAFWTGLRDKGNEFIELIKSGIDAGLTAIRGFFDSAVTFIGDTWNKLRELVSAPVRFVIDTVINNGIIKGWNDLLGLLQLPDSGLTKRLGTINVPGFSRGGVLPGNGTSVGDDMLVVDRRGYPQATVASGEPIISRKAYAQHKPIVDSIIAGKQLPAYFQGGYAPVPGGRVTGLHGTNGAYYGTRWAGDLAMPTGTPVSAWHAGSVASVQRLSTSYGWNILLNHAANIGASRYAHLSRIDVNAGQSVNQGQVIGAVGSTGNSTGPHLHFEIIGGNVPVTGDSGGGGGVSALFNMATQWITDKLSAPVKAMIEKIPGDGAFSGLPKAMASKMLDNAIEKIKSLVPAGSDSSMSGTTAGANWQANANLLMQAGKTLGASRQAMKIALMTASQESSMGTNATAMTRANSDGDVGWFQQRTTRGDGTIAQLADALYGLRVFLYGVNVPGGYHVPGLYDKNWQSMGLGQAAQAVQVSAFPSAYDKWADEAETWLTNFGYRKGTSAARSGWHMTGEDGPELVKFSGGEQVLTAANTEKALADTVEDAIKVLKVSFTNAFLAALIHSNVSKQASTTALAFTATRDASRRLGARDRAANDGTVHERASSGDVHIHNAEFVFPNIKDGGDAEAFMRNLEEYLRRKGN